MTINTNNTTAACSGSEIAPTELHRQVLMPEQPTQEIIDRMTASINCVDVPTSDDPPDRDYDYDMRKAYRAALSATQASAPRSASAGDGVREALEKIDALISNGDRPTVNEQNAFEHFGKLNRLLLSIRDIARAAISVNTTAGATSLGISEDTAQLALDVHARRASPKVGPVGSDDDIRFLALSMAGEAGEAANVVKKAWRDGTPLNRPALAEEIAGTACYLIGISAAIKLNLNAEMREQMAQFELRYASNPLEGKVAK